MDATSLAKLNRDREIFDKINDHIKKLRSRKQTPKKIPPMEEVEAARKNLEEVIIFVAFRTLREKNDFQRESRHEKQRPC